MTAGAGEEIVPGSLRAHSLSHENFRELEATSSESATLQSRDQSLTDPDMLRQEIDRFEAEINARRRGPAASPKQRRRSSLALAFTNIRQKLKKGTGEIGSSENLEQGLTITISPAGLLSEELDSPEPLTPETKRKKSLAKKVSILGPGGVASMGDSKPGLPRNRSNSVFVPSKLSTLAVTGPGGYKEGVLYVHFLPVNPLLLSRGSGSSSAILKASSSSVLLRASSSSSSILLPASGVGSALPLPVLLSRQEAFAAAKKYWVVLDEFFLYAYEDRLDTESPLHEIKLPGTQVRSDKSGAGDYFWLERKGHPLAYIFPDGQEGLEEHAAWSRQLTDICQFYRRGGDPAPSLDVAIQNSSSSSFKSVKSGMSNPPGSDALSKDLKQLEENLEDKASKVEELTAAATTQSLPAQYPAVAAPPLPLSVSLPLSLHAFADSPSSSTPPGGLFGGLPLAATPETTFPEDPERPAQSDLRQQFIEAQKKKQTLLVRQNSQTRGISKS